MRVKGPNPLQILDPGDDAGLAAYLQVLQLKRLFRQGWLKRGVSEADCESVADHSFGVALLALLAPLPESAGGRADDGAPEFVPIDRTKAALLALVHELGEVYAGDITPVDGIPAEEKSRLERGSLELVLSGHAEAETLSALWEEYETGASAEARWVKELDRLEMGLQAALYRAEGKPRMEEFIASADRSVRDANLRSVLRRAAAPDTIA
jgi:putative hydrolase of HD superfamily